MISRSPRQLRFLSTAIQALGPNRCAVKVEMRGAKATYRGSSDGGSTDPEKLQCAARATIDAIKQLGHRIELEAVELVTILGESTVALRVRAEYEGEPRKLVGFCVAGNDVLKATVFAVLNATNRFLEIG
jgi:hypothetical protein